MMLEKYYLGRIDWVGGRVPPLKPSLRRRVDVFDAILHAIFTSIEVSARSNLHLQAINRFKRHRLCIYNTSN